MIAPSAMRRGTAIAWLPCAWRGRDQLEIPGHGDENDRGSEGEGQYARGHKDYILRTVRTMTHPDWDGLEIDLTALWG